MTLIALAVKGDHAEFVTDSMSYTKNLGHLGHTTKSMLLPHLNAAILTAGDGVFGAEAKIVTLHGSNTVPTFDDLVQEAPPRLCKLRESMVTDCGDALLRAAPPTVFLVGFSDRRQQFDAYYLAHEDDFEPERIAGVHVMPASLGERPSDLELCRLWAENPDIDPEIWDKWRERPKRPVPSNFEDWMRLGLECRYDRTLTGFFKTIVGGSLYYTRLERASASTYEIFEFDDQGEELLELVRGTQHPLSQHMPCFCGSDKTFLACHLGDYYADGHPCDCLSGRAFVDCCRAGDDPVHQQVPANS